MARNLSANLLTEFTSDVLRPVFFVRIKFADNNILKLSTLGASITYDGHTYVGTGNLLGVESVDENSDLGVSGIRISLSGLDAQIVQNARNENYQGKECVVLLGAMDESGAVVGTTDYFQGYNDHIVYTQSANKITALLTAENRLVRFSKSKISRYTWAEQIKNYNTDLGLQFVNTIAEAEIKWGA